MFFFIIYLMLDLIYLFYSNSLLSCLFCLFIVLLYYVYFITLRCYSVDYIVFNALYLFKA